MKKLFLSFVLCFSFCMLFAQVSVNPNDAFYSSAREWQIRGIIKTLPQISPYPVSTIKKILETVIQNGNEKEARDAQDYYEKFFGKKWHINLEGGANISLSDYASERGDGNEAKTKVAGFVEPSFSGDLDFLKIVSFGFNLGAKFHNKDTELEKTLPHFFNNIIDDTYGDPATFGSIAGNLEMTANLTVGKENLYGMVGLNRLGYSAFNGDSIVLNPTAYHSGNFVFSYDARKWSYAQTVSAISASKTDGTGGTRPEKFLAFHTVRITPIKQLSISYYEASVYGQRFDICHFIPVPYMAIQGLYMGNENTMSGLQFEVRPIDRLEIALSGVIDDINTNEFAKGNFSSRLKLALQTGVSYAPKVDFLNLISVDYTLITPFTYGHHESNASSDGFNYENYVNRNTCIASSLPPNSDRVRVNVKFSPVPRLKIDLFTTFARHGNSLETINETEAASLIQSVKAGTAGATDGSVWTFPDLKVEEQNTIQETNNFLNQNHIMTVLQVGFNSSYEFPRQKWGTFSLVLGYTFEFIHNKGVDAPMFLASDDATQNGVEVAKARWVRNLHNEFNNYFNISVKYTF